MRAAAGEEAGETRWESGIDAGGALSADWVGRQPVSKTMAANKTRAMLREGMARRLIRTPRRGVPANKSNPTATEKMKRIRRMSGIGGFMPKPAAVRKFQFGERGEVSTADNADFKPPRRKGHPGMGR